MLNELTGKLMNHHHEDDPVLQNALLESFGIHVRALIDFLWLDRPLKDTDAIAHDWIEGWRPPEMSDRLAHVKERVGKEMAHLSYNRLEVPEDKKGWMVLGIGPEAIVAFAQFATEVPDDLVPDGWRERAYSASGTVPADRVAELEKNFIRPEDLRPADLPSLPTQELPPDQGT